MPLVVWTPTGVTKKKGVRHRFRFARVFLGWTVWNRDGQTSTSSPVVLVRNGTWSVPLRGGLFFPSVFFLLFSLFRLFLTYGVFSARRPTDYVVWFAPLVVWTHAGGTEEKGVLDRYRPPEFSRVDFVYRDGRPSTPTSRVR